MTSHGDDSTIRDFHQSLINEKYVLGFCMMKDTALAVDGDNYKIIVPRRRGRFNEEINFPFITQYQDNNNFCYSEVEKTTDYQLIGKRLVLRKDTSSVIKK